MLMNKQEQTLMTPYLQFNRSQWAALRDSVPMTLTEGEITRLKGINEDLSLEEVAEIYLPLSRLLNFYISSNLRRQAVLEQFLGTNGQRIPYIISIAGSVAVGKSTTARVLQALLSRWPEHRRVEHQNIELAPACLNGFGKTTDGIGILEVQRRDRRATAAIMDVIHVQ